MSATRDYLLTMAKHLPPSASSLRLLDMGGIAGETLRQRRDDLDIVAAPLNVRAWAIEPASVDAVVAYDMALRPALLEAVLNVMRPGGRFIVVHPAGQVSQEQVRTLENAGYTRILVEAALNGFGVLIRGEKPHTTADTHQRVQTVAQQDADALTLADFKGRYVHLLIRQHPNQPAWKRQPDEPLTWEAAALARDAGVVLLAFSSLPKAVAFMQPAVLADAVRDVNKVAKFSQATAASWPHDVLLNPTLDALQGERVTFVPVDPATAERPDE